MAISIKSIVYINGTNFTPYLVQPIKWGNFLDERLDEMYITLQSTHVKEFAPLDEVELHTTLANPYRNTEETQTRYFFVANDKSTETPAGSGRYTHEIYCIELTKLLEMYVVDSLTFTNALAKNPSQTSYRVAPYFVTPSTAQTNDYIQENARLFNDDAYSSPVFSGSVDILPLSSVINVSAYPEAMDRIYTGTQIRVYNSENQVIYSYDYPETYIGGTQSNVPSTGGTTLQTLGAVRIEYTVRWRAESGDTARNDATGGAYNIGVSSQRYPSKRITCTDAINRLLDLAIPLYKGTSPQFVLDADDAADFDKIYLPEITMTQNTLRENLQEIGKIIHGEPRLSPYGFNTYKITYDRYGGATQATMPTKYIEKVSEQAIDSYCSSVDSTAQNLVNQLDYATGTIIVPRANGMKTIRTDEVYVRVTDEEMQIVLPLNINYIIKVECLYPGRTSAVDITDYIFEKSVYDAQLSSYSDAYPYSKAYGVYYSIGNDKIEGLSFKLDDAWYPVFENYAIINIIERATGTSIDTSDVNFYPQLRFRVTYVPYFNVRLTQSKPYINEFKRPATLIYNQSANVIESRAYGENLKGVVARLGNPERSITYKVSSFAQIPTAGELYDDDYYISTVACEQYSAFLKCTLGLTKNFNRKSAYIGVSSERRLYEVSEREAYARTTVYKEYIEIGDSTEASDTLLGDVFMSALASTFTQSAQMDKVDHVVAQGEMYDGVDLASVELPVVSTAIGNSIVFIWSYEDNYSAGATVSYQQYGTFSGYFQDNYAYCDYYGKIYYYHFDLRNTSSEGTPDEALALPGTTKTPTDSGIFSTEAYQPYIYRKDSREISQFCAEVEFVTNRKDIIIGSALAARNPLIGAPQQDPVRLYFLPFKVNKFATKITQDLSDVSYCEPNSGYTVSASGKQMSINFYGVAPSHQAWALITPQYTTTQTVEDDEGNATEQTYYEGGEVLLASNTPITTGYTVYFTAVHDPFKRFEIIDTHGSSSMTGSGYKYARYDEGVKRFFCNESVDLQDLNVGDIVFYPTSYNGSAVGKALAQVTILGKSATSVTAKVDIIINKEEA